MFDLIIHQALRLPTEEEFTQEEFRVIQILLELEKPSEFKAIVMEYGTKLNQLVIKLRNIPKSDIKLGTVEITLGRIVSQSIMGEAIL